MENIVTVGGNILGAINFAMQQNYVPIIRNIVINNKTKDVLKNIDIKISFNPEIAKDYEYHIDEILGEQSVEISPVKLNINTEYLFSLTEKMVGNITIEVFQGDNKIFSNDESIEILAFDEWSGLLFMPEIIAAFVTPNHPKISEVLREAAVLLKKWTGSPSFTGYQTRNPNNVKLQMAAIYGALQKQGIIYNNPPASYEVIGQRIRMPHIVLEQKQGTCLDLSVLYLSCLEAVRLFPLIFFIKGHAFCGCWLEEDTFADCVIDDVSAIEKRIVEGAEELLLVECTDFVSGENIDFDRAVKHGKNHIIDLSQFICAVDIQRSRGSGIRPIPLRIENTYSGNNSEVDEELKEAVSEAIPSELDNSIRNKVVKNNKPVTKQKIWERKLLDFSLRNTLLNFRVTKNAFQLMTADLGELEDRLSDGKDFRIMEVPSEWTVSLRDSKIYEIETERDLIKNIATQEFKSYRIRTFLNEQELENNLKQLYRSAKTSMEENGTNTLFLAVGFLRWFESDLSEKVRYAPIILIPIDIVRNVRNKGYVIRSRQEETQVNITLLEYLRQDHNINIGGLDPLPEDEHGVDIPLIFNTIRQAIMGKKRWNIEEMAFVGLFSFGQFVMWNDIHNRSKELEENKVVSSLINGAMNWQQKDDDILADNLDDEFSIKDMAIPVSADSSQMVAIAAAAKGKSFVLQGPPGTGKSQTITNMIANALYQGKTVLFVAEKMAALNVVQKRLVNIGLDPFCLELHSNKTNKSVVLSEINKALEVGKIKSPEEYEATAEKLYSIRKKLNYIIEAVHCKRDFGVSLYEAIEIYEKNINEKGKIKFVKDEILDVNKDKIDEWDELIRQYKIAISELGSYNGTLLSEYIGTEYSMELRDKFKADTDKLVDDWAEINEKVENICKWAGCTDNKNRKTIENLLNIVDAALVDAVTLSKLISSSNYNDIVEKINSLKETGLEYNNLKNKLTEQFEESIFDYDFTNAKLLWKQAEGCWFLQKYFKQKKLLNEIKLYAKDVSTVTKENIIAIYESLEVYNNKKKSINDIPSAITEYLEGLFMGTDTEWNTVSKALSKADVFRTACSTMKDKSLSEIIDAIKKSGMNGLLADYKNDIEEYIKNLDIYSDGKIDFTEAENSPNWFERVKEILVNMKNGSKELRNKISFNQIDNKLRDNGLVKVSESYMQGEINEDNLTSAYMCNLYYMLALITIGSDERLREFQGESYNDFILQYEEKIAEFQKLTIQELVARLSSKIPSTGSISIKDSEMGILKKAIKTNGRMMSLRRLFDQIPTLLRKLCPCMLMSPISVAQYIDPSLPKFDLVIFDEASQLPTSEAVGTIARGENVVVVGDPKQLPPTNFFSSNRVDEENREKEDLESLLDDCLAISMPQISLKWHYRSRHESLIAYSNMKYYDNKLYTFPSPHDLVSEVKMVHLDGFYDKGKTKHNMAEAKAIVAEIVRRLKDEELRNDSIGVVTFSSVQQNLIDDLLYEEFKKYPELEEIDNNSKEPIFIKNLENVQGDERDVILFSIGYGPDADGNISMNFGPLNREGGWRRLNVAISRARKSMIVYSVLKPEQIDLSRTCSEGVAGLKGFLEFAEKGKNNLAQKVGNNKNHDDYIVTDIAKAIKEMGYDVKCNIGCSEFKMDIGVVNPDDSDTYILGILIDGYNCKEASTARDRFVLQPSVLKGLGWSVIRLWTLDWLDDPEKVKNKIKEAIEAAPKTPKIKKTVSPETFAKLQFEKETVISNTSYKKDYISTKISNMGTADEYYSEYAKNSIKDFVMKIIDNEAPISRKLLMHKVLNGWNISRSGARVESIFQSVIENIEKKETKDDERIFYWKMDQLPEKYNYYRVEDAESNKRAMDDVPSHEIINAIIEVLEEEISIGDKTLVREVAKKFGYSRLGNVIESSIKFAIEYGINTEILIKMENGNLKLNENKVVSKFSND